MAPDLPFNLNARRDRIRYLVPDDRPSLDGLDGRQRVSRLPWSVVKYVDIGLYESRSHFFNRPCAEHIGDLGNRKQPPIVALSRVRQAVEFRAGEILMDDVGECAALNVTLLPTPHGQPPLCVSGCQMVRPFLGCGQDTDRLLSTARAACPHSQLEAATCPPSPMPRRCSRQGIGARRACGGLGTAVDKAGSFQSEKSSMLSGPSAGLLKRRYVVMLPLGCRIAAVNSVSASTDRGVPRDGWCRVAARPFPAW